MANIPHGGILSYGVACEIEGASNDRIKATYDRVLLLPPARATPCTYGCLVGKAHTIADLPLQLIIGPKKLKHFIDVIENASMDVDVPAITDIMVKGEYHNLPGILASKEHIPGLPFTMHILIRTDSDEPRRQLIMKHYVCTERIDSRIIDRLAQGAPHSISYGLNQKVGFKVFTAMFEDVGGHQWKSLMNHQPKDTTEKQALDRSPAIREAFSYLRSGAPRGNFDGEQLEWVELEFAKPKSPLGLEFACRGKACMIAAMKKHERG